MIICIVGPTGVGKTKLSIELAKKYHGIVVNADSMQVYKDLNIGTAKIKENEKENIPHFLFDIVNINDDYTIYDYQKDFRVFYDEHKNQNIIMVGGSGLYIKAALYNYELTERTKNNYEGYTNYQLFELVKKKDNCYDVNINNRKRMISFLNSNLTEKHKDELLYDTIFIGLTTDREHLYEIVNKRVDEMINEGLISEVESFYKWGIHSKAINTGIGYKELYAYFNNEVTLDDAIENIKKNTRHFIKRQYTWYKHQMNINWFSVDFNNFNKTVNEVSEFIEKTHDIH